METVDSVVSFPRSHSRASDMMQNRKVEDRYLKDKTSKNRKMCSFAENVLRECYDSAAYKEIFHRLSAASIS